MLVAVDPADQRRVSRPRASRPAVSRTGAEGSPVLSPLQSERLWAWDCNRGAEQGCWPSGKAALPSPTRAHARCTQHRETQAAESVRPGAVAGPRRRPQSCALVFPAGHLVWPVAGGGEGSGGVAGARPPASLALQTSPPGVRPCSLVTSTGGPAPGGGMGRQWGHRVRPS